jgi:Mce-associated membrane protein
MTVDTTPEARPITVIRVDPGQPRADAVRRWRRRLPAAAVAALVGLAALAWQLTTEPSDDSELEAAAMARDGVVIAASGAVEVLNTLDHRDVAAGLEAWESVATGALQEQIGAIDRRESAALARAGAVSSARVVEAAVVSLDVDAGTATAIAFTEVTVTARSGSDVVEHHRYSVDLRRVGERWLVEAMVPMELEQ